MEDIMYDMIKSCYSPCYQQNFFNAAKTGPLVTAKEREWIDPSYFCHIKTHFNRFFNMEKCTL